MRKILSALLTLSLLLSLAPLIQAELPATSGAPAFEVTTEVAPVPELMTSITTDTVTVLPGQAVQLTATTSYTSNKSEHQLLHFVSDGWQGVDSAAPALPITLEAEPAADPNERQQVFVSTASVVLGEEPGDYDVALTYTITLQHDASGMRIYTATASHVFTVTVLDAQVSEEDEAEEDPSQGTPLNHGQIVSTWAHWKQTKGNHNFKKGGPGVYRSLNWYKTQVEYKTFYSKQEVIDYLESIYEPEPQGKGDPGKGNPGKGNPGKGKPGK